MDPLLTSALFGGLGGLTQFALNGLKHRKKGLTLELAPIQIAVALGIGAIIGKTFNATPFLSFAAAYVVIDLISWMFAVGRSK